MDASLVISAVGVDVAALPNAELPGALPKLVWPKTDPPKALVGWDANALEPPLPKVEEAPPNVPKGDEVPPVVEEPPKVEVEDDGWAEPNGGGDVEAKAENPVEVDAGFPNDDAAPKADGVPNEGCPNALGGVWAKGGPNFVLWSSADMDASG